jgi:hypothetical protein
MSTTFVVPIHGSSKYKVHVPIANDTEAVEHFVFDRLDDSLNVSLQVG